MAVTGDFALALRADGSVLSFGTGMSGGSGTPLAGSAANVITGATGAVSVAAYAGVGGLDAKYGVFLRKDGSPLGWGGTDLAGMGLGVYTYTPSITLAYAAPNPLGTLNGLVDVQLVQGGVTVGLDQAGKLWILGGTADIIAKTVIPLSISGLPNLKALGSAANLSANAGTLSHSLVPVIDTSGNVQLLTVSGVGDGLGGTTMTAVVTGAMVGGLPAVQQVACSGQALSRYHCLALDVSGSVWSWGPGGDNGQIGDGGKVGRTIPVRLTGIPKVAQIATSPTNSYAVDSTGNVYSWGQALFGGLGMSSTLTDVLVPTVVPGVVGAVEIASMTSSEIPGAEVGVLVRTVDGSVYGWGSNLSGELGTGTVGAVSVPTKLPGINLN